VARLRPGAYDLAMKPSAVLLVALTAQTLTPSPRQLARLARPLQPSEVHAVLAAAREAAADRTLLLAYLGRDDGLEILMGGDGWPRLLRSEGGLKGGTVVGSTATEWTDYFVHISNHTGEPARRCDGSTVSGELVITYTHTRSTNTWTARASTKGWVPVCNPVFDVLAGRVATVSDTRKDIDGHTARGFTAPFSCAPGTYGLGDSLTEATQTLFIDVDSLLPVRWEVFDGHNVSDTRVLKYRQFDIRVPERVDPPQCIP
jgi:hypothetical protein